MTHIKTTCPRCESTYHVDPALRGKRMRCPNGACRWIFEVHEGGTAPPVPPAPAPPTPPPAPPSQRVGAVGDMVPILEAEPAASPPPPPEAAVEPPPSALSGTYLQPPPVRAAGPAPPPAPPAESARGRKPPPPKKRTSGLAPPRSAPPPGAPPAEGPAPGPPPVRVERTPVADRAEPLPEPLPPAPAGPSEEGAALDADALEMLRELGLGAEALPAAEAGPAPVAEQPPQYALASGGLPPVRRGDALDFVAEAPLPSAVSTPLADEPEERPQRKRLRSLVLMLLLLALVGGAVWWAVAGRTPRPTGNEAERAQRALKAYEAGDFGEAAQQFRELALEFADGAGAPKYRFLAELSDIREPIYRVQPPEALERNLERLGQFAGEYKDDPLLEKHLGELHDSFKRMGVEFKELAKQKLDERLLRIARQVYKRAYDYTPARAVPADVTAELNAIGQAVAASDLRKDLLAYLDRIVKTPSAAVVQEARARVATARLDQDAEVKARLERLPEAHRGAIRYTPVQDLQEQTPPAEDLAPGSLVTPALEAYREEVRPGQRPVLALARGVLYALEPDNGQVRWAVRVSPEAAALPLWLPQTALAPAQVLVLSSDSLTLSALDAYTGATRWSRRLAAPCLGQPVLVGDRAFVPGYAGRVEEIEVNDGALRGFYELGQTLTTGGVRQAGTDLVYFAADGFCVYALDVARRTCAAVLYTGHPGGSLLSRPIVLGGGPAVEGKQAAAGYLLLSQADGLDAMKLRAFALPGATADAAPVQEVPLSGWASFPPKTHGDNLALVTDAGEFVVYGVEAHGERSAPLFPRLHTKIRPPVLGPPGQARAQLVHAEAGGFWVLAHGELHRLQATFTRAQGPHLDPPGPALLRVGSPLHAAQARADGGLTLFLVTQSGDGQACLVTAVGGRGEMHWQRQLGLVTRGQPVPAGAQLLAEDLSGRLFLFDAANAPPGTDRAWYFAGRLVRGRGARGGAAFQLLPSGDKTYAVAAVRGVSGPALRVRIFPAPKGPEPPDFPLQAPPAGTPAVVGSGLVVPLANGVLVRQPLAGGSAETGPNWRDERADPGAAAYVVALSADEFLVTDGSRMVKRLSFDGKLFETRATGELPDRIAAPPAVLPRREGEEVRVCVADSAHVLTLLEGEGLKAVRRWRLGGAITAGPFVRGGGVVCVVDRRKLVWVDPAKDEQPLWGADFRGDVVGEPQLIDGVLVVADQRGQIQGLDPASGKAVGPGYAVVASAAPTAAPLAFGPERLFVPLTDGTVLLPPRSCLQHPLRGFPMFR